jgi:hypothetical protein
MSDEPRSNGNLRQQSTGKDEQCASEVRTCLVCHRTVRCIYKTKNFNGQPLQTPTMCWRGTHRTMNIVLSGAPSTATTRIVVGATNTPNHLHSSHPSFMNSTFNTRAKAISNAHSIDQVLSKPPNQLNCLVTGERVFCVLLLLLFLGLLSSSHSYFSKCFVKLARDT